MKDRILLVGEDPFLISSRALLLSEWDTETVASSDATERLETETFDLLILCQTVTHAKAKALIATAKELESPPEILMIRFGAGGEDLGVNTHLRDLRESPGWLRDTAAGMLSSRVVA